MKNIEKIRAFFKKDNERDEQHDIAIVVIIISLFVIAVLAMQLR